LTIHQLQSTTNTATTKQYSFLECSVSVVSSQLHVVYSVTCSYRELPSNCVHICVH